MYRLVKMTSCSSNRAPELQRKFVFERNVVVGAKQAGLSYLEIADLLDL